MPESRVTIEHFSDILCIWAYVGQVRMDELRQQFPDEVSVTYRFIPLFGDTAVRIGEGWQDRGGFAGYADHVQEIAAGWEHVDVHGGVWRDTAPASSTPGHLFLKAVQLLYERGEIASGPQPELGGRSLPEEAAWRLRHRFFTGAEDIARTEVQDEVAVELGLPLDDLRAIYANGAAHAMLHADLVERDRYQIPGSPTLLMAGGRQRLFGNVGYRILEANVRELLQNPRSGQASWC
ncbi:MAG: DsbA family protein [Thiohalorhabdus sp.]|uniref:DsbA family oxidoreductase n=1 Tax=Thiohalorhabdus sp. TaxID=3094134 RepID=UPI002FC32AB8